MQVPKLKTVDKFHALYPVGQFPSSFAMNLGREIVYVLATRVPISIEGKDWEKIFADSIGAIWSPSNVGLDDVQCQQMAWSAKTVFNKKPFTVNHVRLISGRNSLDYSFEVENVHTEDPNKLGEMVLAIWNGRVTDVRRHFAITRTVVLIKSETFREFAVFEEETLKFLPEDYYWEWNSNNNLEGYEKTTDKKRFTWQPHGSQFTVITDVPANRLKLRIKKPDVLDKESVLGIVRFDSSWVEIVQ